MLTGITLRVGKDYYIGIDRNAVEGEDTIALAVGARGGVTLTLAEAGELRDALTNLLVQRSEGA